MRAKVSSLETSIKKSVASGVNVNMAHGRNIHATGPNSWDLMAYHRYISMQEIIFENIGHWIYGFALPLSA